MDVKAHQLLNLRKKMEQESGVQGRAMTTNVVCLLYDVAKALGYSDRVAERITGDRLIDEPVFSRKRRLSRTHRRA